MFDEDKNISEDYDMWLRIAKRRKVGYLAAPLVRYRINPRGYSRSSIDLSYEREYKAFSKALSCYDGDREKMSHARKAGLYRRMGNSFLDIKDYKRALSAFLDAFKMKIM